MTLQEIQYKAQAIIQKWRDDDSAPYIEFVEELAHMFVPELQGLDEAAEESMKAAIERFYDTVGKPRALVNEREVDDFAEELFKAGAEWMAGQGVTCEFDHFVETLRTLDKHGFKRGDKVIIQIRKIDKKKE